MTIRPLPTLGTSFWDALQRLNMLIHTFLVCLLSLVCCSSLLSRRDPVAATNTEGCPTEHPRIILLLLCAVFCRTSGKKSNIRLEMLLQNSSVKEAPLYFHQRAYLSTLLQIVGTKDSSSLPFSQVLHILQEERLPPAAVKEHRLIHFSFTRQGRRHTFTRIRALYFISQMLNRGSTRRHPSSRIKVHPSSSSIPQSR
jgi:hypothetical protein